MKKLKTKKQKEVLESFIECGALNQQTALPPLGVEYLVSKNLAKMGILNTIDGGSFWVRQIGEKAKNYKTFIVYGNTIMINGKTVRCYGDDINFVICRNKDTYSWKIILQAIYRMASKIVMKRKDVMVEGWEGNFENKKSKFPRFEFNGKNFIQIKNK